MDNNQFVPQKNNKKIFSIVGLVCSCVGLLLTILFSIITCSRGYDASCKKLYGQKVFSYKLHMSLWVIGVIIAVIIAIVGIVLSILSIEKGSKLSKMVIISIVAGAFAIVYAMFTNVTICSYNCSLNSNKSMKEASEYMNDISSDYSDYFDFD